MRSRAAVHAVAVDDRSRGARSRCARTCRRPLRQRGSAKRDDGDPSGVDARAARPARRRVRSVAPMMSSAQLSLATTQRRRRVGPAPAAGGRAGRARRQRGRRRARTARTPPRRAASARRGSHGHVAGPRRARSGARRPPCRCRVEDRAVQPRARRAARAALVRLPLCARARLPLLEREHERLGVRQTRSRRWSSSARARCRRRPPAAARVSARRSASRDQAHAAVCVHARPSTGGDARALLAAVLQREQREVRQLAPPRGGAQMPEDAALLLPAAGRRSVKPLDRRMFSASAMDMAYLPGRREVGTGSSTTATPSMAMRASLRRSTRSSGRERRARDQRRSTARGAPGALQQDARLRLRRRASRRVASAARRRRSGACARAADDAVVVAPMAADRRLGERHGEAAVAAVVRRAHEPRRGSPRARSLHRDSTSRSSGGPRPRQLVLPRRYSLPSSATACSAADQRRSRCRPCVNACVVMSARSSISPTMPITGVGWMSSRRRLVVERDVAADHRRAERAARLADARDRLLPAAS